jgi:hypothetical protein
MSDAIPPKDTPPAGPEDVFPQPGPVGPPTVHAVWAASAPEPASPQQRPAMPPVRRAGLAALLAVGVLAVAVLGVNALGNAPSNRTTVAGADPTATPAAPGEAQSLCESFLSSLASELGVTVDKLQSGLLAASEATIDKAVADGVLTQDQAAFLKGRLSSVDKPLCQGFPVGRLGDGMRGHMRLQIDAGSLLDAAASALKIDRQQLLTELGALKQGEDLKTIAANHNVDYATVTAAVHGAAKTQLDAQVKAGTLTQAQEDAYLTALDARLAKGQPFGLPFGGRLPRMGGDGIGPFEFPGGMPFGGGPFGGGAGRGWGPQGGTPKASPAPTAGNNG